MRGRIFSVASLWIGRPLSVISISTSAMSVSCVAPDRLDLADVHAGDADRRVRRGCSSRSRTTALTRKPFVNGMSFVKPEVRADDERGEHEQADDDGARAAAVLARDARLLAPSARSPPACSRRRLCVATAGCPRCRGRSSSSRCRVPWLPGTLPMTARPSATARCPPRTRSVAPAARRVRVRVGVQEVRRRPGRRWPGADDGPPSLFGPCGAATMMNRCQVPLSSPSDSRRRDVAEPQRHVVARRLHRREVGDRRVEDLRGGASGR